jgi:hypothetical protein
MKATLLKLNSMNQLNSAERKNIRGGIARNWHTCSSTCEVFPGQLECVYNCPDGYCIRGLVTFDYCL